MMPPAIFIAEEKEPSLYIVFVAEYKPGTAAVDIPRDEIIGSYPEAEARAIATETARSRGLAVIDLNQ
jgi:hypothetical protein